MIIQAIQPNKTQYKSLNFEAKREASIKHLRENLDLKVFHHHIYEYKKGIRNLILTTEKNIYKDKITSRLEREKIDYVIHDLENGNMNVFFGEKACVDVVRTFNPRLNEVSAEQDFMLGIMLGYDRVKQCVRYLKLKDTIFAGSGK